MSSRHKWILGIAKQLSRNGFLTCSWCFIYYVYSFKLNYSLILSFKYIYSLWVCFALFLLKNHWWCEVISRHHSHVYKSSCLIIFASQCIYCKEIYFILKKKLTRAITIYSKTLILLSTTFTIRLELNAITNQRLTYNRGRKWFYFRGIWTTFSFQIIGGKMLTVRNWHH